MTNQNQNQNPTIPVTPTTPREPKTDNPIATPAHQPRHEEKRSDGDKRDAK